MTSNGTGMPTGPQMAWVEVQQMVRESNERDRLRARVKVLETALGKVQSTAHGAWVATADGNRGKLELIEDISRRVLNGGTP